MAICEHIDCRRTAEVAPKIVVPHAVGFPLDKKRQYEMILGLKLCRRHCAQVDAPAQALQQQFVDVIRRLAASIARKRGLPYQEPDFERASAVAVRFESDEYRRLEPQLRRSILPRSNDNG